MKVGKTILVNEESARKQVSMPRWAYETLKRLTEQADNGVWTKGLLAYEALLLTNDEYEDPFTRIEFQIDAELADEIGTPSLAYLNKIKFSDIPEGKHELARKVVDADPYEIAERVNVHLPVSLDAQIEGRGLGHEIAHGLAHIQAAPWSSRLGRCEVKRQLLQYARGKRVDEPHPFVEAVMEENTSRWDIDELLTAFCYDNWWESPDVTFDMIRERGEEIPQTANWRIPALQAAVNNAEGTVTRSEVIDAAKEWMDVTTDATAQKYADKIDFGESGGVTVDFVTDGLKEIAQMLDDRMPEGHEMADLPAHELLLIDEAVYDVDGSYPSIDEAQDALESIRDMSNKGPASAPARAKGNAAFYEWLDREIATFTA